MKRKITESLENPNYKGIKPFIAEIEKHNEDKQKYVDDLYRSISDIGAQRLDKVIGAYNKKHKDEQLKTHSQVMKEYEKNITEAAELFKQAEPDELKFAHLMDSVKKEDLQDVIDEISKSSEDVQGLNNLSRLAKTYGEKVGARIRVSDFKEAELQAESLLSILSGEDEQAFRKGILEIRDLMSSPDDYQAMINILDKKLDYRGRKTLDDAIISNNKYNKQNYKFETNRIKLKESEKASSWQRFSNENPIEQSYTSFKKYLDELKKSRCRPEDKYDKGFINNTLRHLINIQNYIAKLADFISNKLDNLLKEQEKPESKPDPFYDIMKDAYKEKGAAVMTMLNASKSAEDLFAMDIAYIKSQNLDKQKELLQEYTNGINEVMKQPDISFEAKTAMTQLIADYEFGKLDAKIEGYQKNGFDWRGVYSDIKKDDIKAEVEKSEIVKKSECVKEMNAIGNDIADFKNADEIMKAFVDNISRFAHKHKDLSKEEIHKYITIGVSSLLSHDLPECEKELKNNLSQYDDKHFRAKSDKSRIYTLLDAANVVDLAYTNQINNGKSVEYDTSILESLHRTVENAISDLNPAQRQDFIESIANTLNNDRKQYFLAIEAKKFSLRAEAPKKIENEHKIDEKVVTLADKYEKFSKTGNKNLIPDKSLIAFCDNTPESLGGAQIVIDKLKEKLKDSPEALKIVEADVATLNELNKKYGLLEIRDGVEIEQNAANIFTINEGRSLDMDDILEETIKQQKEDGINLEDFGCPPDDIEMI